MELLHRETLYVFGIFKENLQTDRVHFDIFVTTKKYVFFVS